MAHGNPRATQIAKESGAKTTLCRHGDIKLQTATSIYVVLSRFGIGGDLGNFRREEVAEFQLIEGPEV